MATARYDINGSAWTAISSAGQSGTAFLLSPSSTLVVIDHSTSGSSACAISKGIPIFPYCDHHPDASLKLTKDSESDIFYARCVSVDAVASLIVDVI